VTRLARIKPGLRDGLIRASAPIASALYRESPRVRVISLHDVGEGGGAALAGKLRLLRDEYNVVSLADAYERTELDPGRLNVALTLDDGYDDHATVVAPLFAAHAVPATFFVPSGSLDLDPAAADRFAARGLRRRRSLRFMTSAQLGELAADPLFTIGGHTAHHADLGRPASDEALDTEIAGDRAALERTTGKPVEWFAFPFGGVRHVSEPAVRALRRAGYRAAFTIMPGFWSRRQDRFLVGRDSLSVEASDELWRSWLAGGYDAITWLKYRVSTRRGGRGPRGSS
jgi:peptidoglycan/xylan/chitin deacetylase (PgdA/CDA1 family)